MTKAGLDKGYGPRDGVRRNRRLGLNAALTHTALIALTCATAPVAQAKSSHGLAGLPWHMMPQDGGIIGGNAVGLMRPIALYDPYAGSSEPLRASAVAAPAAPATLTGDAPQLAALQMPALQPIRPSAILRGQTAHAVLPDAPVAPAASAAAGADHMLRPDIAALVARDEDVLFSDRAFVPSTQPPAEILQAIKAPSAQAVSPAMISASAVTSAPLMASGDRVELEPLDIEAPVLRNMKLAMSDAAADTVAKTPTAPASASENPIAPETGTSSLAAPAAPEQPKLEPEKAKALAEAQKEVSEALLARADSVAGPPAPAGTSGLDREPYDEAMDNDAESLREAIVASLRSNPDIQIAVAKQDDARFGIHEANSGYLPHLDLSVGGGREVNHGYNSASTNLMRTESSVTVTQNIWDFGTTINDIKRARASYRAAQWGTREKIEAISYDITNAYVTILEKQKIVALTEQEIEAHKKILKMVSIQNELGLTTTADVDRARARLKAVESELLDRRSELEQAREGYRRLTQHLPGRAIDLPSPAGGLPPDVEAAVTMIDSHSPRLAQAVEDRRSLDRQKASQEGNFFPRIGFQAQGNWKNDVQGDTNLNRDVRGMLTLNYTFSGGREIAVRNRIDARLRQADYELDRRRREVEQDIRIDFTAMEAARAKMATIESEITAAENVVKLYHQQFREGRRTVFDLLDSQQALYRARINRLNNETAKNLAEYRVLQKLGGLFDLVSMGQQLPRIAEPAPAPKVKKTG